MSTSSTVRAERVSLDTAGDLDRIKASFLEHFLQVVEDETREQGGKESDRKALFKHAKHRVDDLFDRVQPNLRINGQEYATGKDKGDTEPFDEALDRLIWSLADSRLGWHKMLSATRRTVPREIEEKLVAVQRKRDPIAQLDDDEDVDMSPVELELDAGDAALEARHAQIEAEMRKASAVGGELGQSLPKYTERTQRLEKVAADIRIT